MAKEDESIAKASTTRTLPSMAQTPAKAPPVARVLDSVIYQRQDYKLGTATRTIEPLEKIERYFKRGRKIKLKIKKCHELLKPGGFVYVELPDGECAAKKGMPREEFFIEHLHVFSLQSTILLAERAGFMMYKIFRTHEPSDKYSLRAFLVPKISN